MSLSPASEDGSNCFIYTTECGVIWLSSPPFRLLTTSKQASKLSDFMVLPTSKDKKLAGAVSLCMHVPIAPEEENVAFNICLRVCFLFFCLLLLSRYTHFGNLRIRVQYMTLNRFMNTLLDINACYRQRWYTLHYPACQSTWDHQPDSKTFLTLAMFCRWHGRQILPSLSFPFPFFVIWSHLPRYFLLVHVDLLWKVRDLFILRYYFARTIIE